MVLNVELYACPKHQSCEATTRTPSCEDSKYFPPMEAFSEIYWKIHRKIRKQTEGEDVSGPGSRSATGEGAKGCQGRGEG